MDKKYIESVDKIELLCGHYEKGRYAWVLGGIEIIDSIEARGNSGYGIIIIVIDLISK